MADSVHDLIRRAILEDLQAGRVEARSIVAGTDSGRYRASSMDYCVRKMASFARREKGLTGV
jgi:hypothetical protein